MRSSPNILILNDPARGVDVGAKTDLYAYLRDFAATGKSVVYLSSEIEELIGFCSRVLVFRSGHVFAELVGDEINGERILAAMFGQISAHHSEPRAEAGGVVKGRDADAQKDEAGAPSWGQVARKTLVARPLHSAVARLRQWRRHARALC